MQKMGLNSAKVEMKGRCSMGQKVLASIVIRLALAEVFSHNARILALDEPTTFLDREHIRMLAGALGRLIEINQEGGALQLIIISHDLEFIKGLEKYTDHYYQVSRDHQQFSVIQEQDIRQIFATKDQS
jgi:DNA repair protein RAD50